MIKHGAKLATVGFESVKLLKDSRHPLHTRCDSRPKLRLKMMQGKDRLGRDIAHQVWT